METPSPALVTNDINWVLTYERQLLAEKVEDKAVDWQRNRICNKANTEAKNSGSR